jgi:hypothetical protein
MIMTRHPTLVTKKQIRTHVILIRSSFFAVDCQAAATDLENLEEGEKVLLIPVEEGIMLNPLRKVRSILRQEIDVEKASAFVKEIRKEWRLD